MKISRMLSLLLCLFLLGSLPAWASGKATSSRKAVQTAGRHKAKSKKKRVRGQQAMNSDRIRAIQTALIREGLLTGEPSGQWDARTKEAMQKYQRANGWQTKVLPDSRALIKLGLGPNYAGLMNPDAVSNPPEIPAGDPVPQR